MQVLDPNLADAELVERAQRELPYVTTAYEALIRRHERLVFGACLRMLGNREDAEDVYQDVLFKLFNAIPAFEGRSSFKTWLMRIVVNGCNTAYARRRRRSENVEQFEEGADYDTSSKIGTAGFDVATLLAHLDDDDRHLVVLRYVAECSFEEIAEVMNMGLSATKMRIYRAIEKLKARIA